MLNIELCNEIAFVMRLISELNLELGLKIDLCPGFIEKKPLQNLTSRECKLCWQGNKSMLTLWVTVDRFATDGSLNQRAKSNLRLAILELCDERNNYQEGRVRIEY